MTFIWSARLFRLMLCLYPAQHRAEYGEAMAQHFHDICRDAYARHGTRGLVSVYLEAAGDTLKNAPVEQWTAKRAGVIMRNKTLLVAVLAIIGSLFIATIDSRATEVYATLMVMLPIAFVLGFIEPKRAWMWALIIGLSVPAGFLWHIVMASTYVEPPSNGFYTLITLVPAFIGTYCGVALRKIFSIAATPNHS